jgi:hypothetical protein
VVSARDKLAEWLEETTWVERQVPEVMPPVPASAFETYPMGATSPEPGPDAMWWRATPEIAKPGTWSAEYAVDVSGPAMVHWARMTAAGEWEMIDAAGNPIGVDVSPAGRLEFAEGAATFEVVDTPRGSYPREISGGSYPRQTIRWSDPPMVGDVLECSAAHGPPDHSAVPVVSLDHVTPEEIAAIGAQLAGPGTWSMTPLSFDGVEIGPRVTGALSGFRVAWDNRPLLPAPDLHPITRTMANTGQLWAELCAAIAAAFGFVVDAAGEASGVVAEVQEVRPARPRHRMDTRTCPTHGERYRAGQCRRCQITANRAMSRRRQ